MIGKYRLSALLLLGVLAISTAAVLIKLCDDAGPAVIAAARMGVAAIVLLPVAGVVHGRRLARIPRRNRLLIVLAGFFLAAHFFFWISSLKHTSVMSSVVIVTTNPIFVGIASWLLFKERLRGGQIAGILLACGGGVLIALSDAGGGEDSLYGDLLSLAGAVMASCYLLAGRAVRREVDTISYILPVYGIAAIVLCVAAWLRGEAALGLSSQTYLYLVLLALVPQVIGHSTLNWALKHMTATFIAVCILGEPIGATLFACLFLGETIAPLQGAGAVLILAGIWLSAKPVKPTVAV